MNHPQTVQRTTQQPTLNAADLHHFTGTVNWYRAPMSQKITMTDGIHHVVEHGGAVWLIVDIVAAQHDPAVAAEKFQAWTLKVNPDRTAELTCGDRNDNIIYTQKYETTNFPLDKIEFFLTNNVILLPSEY